MVRNGRASDAQGRNSQADVLALLADPRSYPDHVDSVERLETHGAYVFLAGDRAFKIKRAVRYDYMDLSTPEKRRHMIERELDINRRFAPSLYLTTVAITREANGALTIGGSGEPLEHALVMRRFPEADVLSRMAARGDLTSALATALADTIARMHRDLPANPVDDGDVRMSRTISALRNGLAGLEVILGAADPARFDALARQQLARAAACLKARGNAGSIRRCHGDLHLNNIVLLNGVPTPFDALEFDENLATVDTLYDLAFLLMDLEHAGLRAEANRVLNRYLWRTRTLIDVDGLIALPLFLGLRSAVRAMTTAQRAALATDGEGTKHVDAARSYLGDAIRYVSPSPARLVAVGGYSGTGKTTLAAALAHRIGSAPGALHVRTDLERKALFDVEETDRLPPETYTREASAAVYAATLEKAERALAAGHSVILDAAYLRHGERSETEAMAARHFVAFTGLFLTAPRNTLLARVASRTGDASDATPEVVASQLALDVGPMTWHLVEAGGNRETTLENALAHLTDAA